MLQFYFLSILLNLIAGLIFVYSTKNEETSLVLSDSDDPFAENTAESSNPDDPFAEESGDSPKKSASEGGFKALALPFLGDKTLQLVVGILSALTGLMKLLSPIQYDVPVVGDLVPSLAGIAAGAVLLLDWYQERSDIALPLPDSIQTIYTGGRKYLGIFCIIAACLHFIFPRVLFL
ncbi:MAG: hypothetical protein IJ158_13510 [Treponema sp.]|nr:hypothetical protein [Treponema sp.]